MSPRRRSTKRRDFPANLYERDGYYSWRDPRTREEQPLGRIPKPDAFAQAIEANLHLAKLLNKPRLIDRLTGDANRSVQAWLAKYQVVLDGRGLSANTLRSYKSLAKRTLATFGGDTTLKSITALRVSEELEKLGSTRIAQAWRGFIHEMFREAIVKGWVDVNPVRETRAGKVEVRRARLTLPILMQVYEAAPQVWLKNAIALALVSAQRREDIALAKFTDVREDAWWVDQGKTGSRIVLPYPLTLTAFGMSLGDVIKQCRKTGVVSPYLVHQTEDYGNSPRGTPIWKDTISRRFTDVLSGLGLTFEGKQPPTFHEIRSLSERLHRAQGSVDTQVLLGHRDPRSTQLYNNARGGWVRLKISNE